MYAPLELSPSLSILESSSALASAEDRESSRGRLQAILRSAGGTDRVDWQPTLLWSASLGRSEDHTSELQSLMRISYAVFSLYKTTIFSFTSFFIFFLSFF